MPLQLQLLHQAAEIPSRASPVNSPAGEIGVLIRCTLFDFGSWSSLNRQRHRGPIHVGYAGEIRGGIFQQPGDSRQCQHPAVQRDGLIHLEIAVFVQQPQRSARESTSVAATAGQGGAAQNRLIFLGCVAQRIAPASKRRSWQQRERHAQAQHQRQKTFHHDVFPSCFCGSVLSAPSFFWFSLFLSRSTARDHAAAAKETTATST